ncbi:MAG: bifunctional oligoribonuclease/PAP phosphatase NrnA [Patescibacteria group bacterium]
MFGSEILRAIDNSKKIILICHRHPDSDTLGSAGALAFFIEEKNKNVEIFCSTEISGGLDFLHLQKFYNYQPDFQSAELLICLDCADERQTGLTQNIFAEQREKIINIDHHLTNTQFGLTNLVLPVSSTCEIIWQIFAENSLPINENQATALLAGILTDTNFFSNGATNKEVLFIAGELLKKNADKNLIISSLLQRNSLATLKIWGKILSSVEFNAHYGIASVVLPIENEIVNDVFEGLANFLTKMHEAKIIMVIRENPNDEIKVSLRTTRDNIDVAQIAKKFGGGGHQKAAGFSLKGKLMKTNSGWTIF